MNPRTVLILGMHRSGTSLMANWLQSCGLNIGENLLVGDSFSNPNGHFEDLDFLKLHQELLIQSGVYQSGIDPSAIDPIVLNQESINRIKSLLNKKQESIISWGWKDPRSVLFINTYDILLPNALFIVLYRNPYEVVNSLYKRDLKVLTKSHTSEKIGFYSYIKTYFKTLLGKPSIRAKYLKVWVNYNRILISQLKDKVPEKVLFVNIKDIQKKDSGIIKWLNLRGANLRFRPLDDFFIMEKLNKTNQRVTKSFALDLYKELDLYSNKSI